MEQGRQKIYCAQCNEEILEFATVYTLQVVNQDIYWYDDQPFCGIDCISSKYKVNKPPWLGPSHNTE
jgi:hypothetical protein